MQLPSPATYTSPYAPRMQSPIPSTLLSERTNPQLQSQHRQIAAQSMVQGSGTDHATHSGPHGYGVDGAGAYSSSEVAGEGVIAAQEQTTTGSQGGRTGRTNAPSRNGGHDTRAAQNPNGDRGSERKTGEAEERRGRRHRSRDGDVSRDGKSRQRGADGSKPHSTHSHGRRSEAGPAMEGERRRRRQQEGAVESGAVDGSAVNGAGAVSGADDERAALLKRAQTRNSVIRVYVQNLDLSM